MQTSEWIVLTLGFAAFVGSIWSNSIAQKALKAAGQQRIAEFRQSWIENLRLHVSEFMIASFKFDAAIKRLAVYTSKSKNVSQARIWRERKIEAEQEMIGHFSFVKLCLNSNERDHQQLLYSMTTMLNDEWIVKVEGSEFEEDLSVNDAAKVVLKREWERLKLDIKNA